MAKGVSFFEVMRGDLVDRWGRRHAADFEIKAEAPSARRFARAGKARITGVVHAPAWVTHAPLQGEIEISLLRRRAIEYRFAFRNEDDEAFELRGRKDFRLRRPVESLTRMRATLHRDDETIAQGHLHFDLNTVVSFFGSWWPSSSIRPPQHVTAPAPAPVPELLDAKERAIFTALAEGTIAAGSRVPASDERTIEDALTHLQTAPASARLGFRAGLRWLDATARVRTGHSLTALELPARAAFLDSLAKAEAVARLRRYRGSIPVDLLLAVLTIPIRAAHFQRPGYLSSIGHPTPLKVAPEPQARHFARVKVPEALEEVTEVHAEVAVVGTGAGGAAVAAALAEKGIAVAILEEGRYRRRHQFSGSPAQRVQALWRGAGTNFALGPPLALPQGKVVGGTTTINSGTCFTTPDSVLREWQRDLGFPSDFDPDSYHRYSARVARTLDVAPGDTKALGKIAGVIARGADALGLSHGPLPRNAPGCPGAGECILGCPEGAKRSTDVSYIPAALKAGAELYVGLPMTRILKRGRRVVALEARGTDENGARKVVRVFAERFVLSCGSLQTPVVLFENGLGSARVGRNLSVHPAMGLVARCPESLSPWAAIPQGYSVHGLEDEGIQLEGFYLPPQILAALLPWVGHELTRWMDDFDRLGQFGLMVRDRGDGWVRRGPDGRPLVGYRLSEASQRKLLRAVSRVAKVFVAAGATEVYPGIARLPLVRTMAEAEGLANARPRAIDFRLLGAHPLGTCAMAASPDRGVVDFEHRVFGTDNLHIVDGSTVPTSLGVNPQMTIMAMALRAADIIEARLSSGTLPV